MADQDSFPVGQAPWEQGGAHDPHPDSFPAGQAPWEAQESSSKEEPGILGSVLHSVAAVGKKIDSYTGAPTRSAISAAQEGHNPLTAFSKQFGEDPENAPTGRQIAAKAGVNDERKLFKTAAEQRTFDEKYNPGLAEARKRGKGYEDEYSFSPAQVAGVGIDVAADPLNLIPAAGMAKKLASAARPAVEIADAARSVSKPGVIASTADKLKSFAENTAINATGATGKQASTFADNAGRELLDRRLVRFGDSQAKISERAGKAVQEANSQIDEALSKLDQRGVKVDRNTIYNTVRDKINELRTDESKADVANLLEKELDNVVGAAHASGTAEIPISKAEQIKRGFNRKAGNWMDPEKGMAGKEMYQTYRNAVEDAATVADPEVAQVFKEGKQTHGLLAPIQEAAERRATTNAQQSHGNLTDLVAAEVGEKALGPLGLIAPLARRIVSPRIASSIAVTADSAANALRKVPAFADMEVKNPALFSSVASHLASSDLSSVSKAAEQPASKGTTKWANDGFKNLLDHVDDSERESIAREREKLLSSPAGKKLLISASDLKPGSKAMDNILTKIKALGEKR